MSDNPGSFMGGSPGDGFRQQGLQQQQQPATMGGYSNFPQPTPNNTPHQTSQPQPKQPTSPMVGSVTRFAPQQPVGTPLYPQSSPYSFSPPPQPQTAGMSYAQRAAMLRQKQGVYQQPQQASNSVYSPQPQQQQNAYGPPQQRAPPQQPSGYPQQTIQQQPSQVQQQPKPQPSQNSLGNNGGNSYAAGSFAQRSQALMQQRQQQQQQQQQPQQSGMVYASQQQQQQPQVMMGNAYQYQSPPVKTLSQPDPGSMGTPQQQIPPPHYGAPQQQQPQPASQYQQPQPAAGGSSYAQRSAMAHSVGGGNASMQSPTMVPQQQQLPQMQQQRQQQAHPKPNIFVDPPEIIAQQNRLLTNATRKVQEHAYYMKQAMDRNDLPTVLDRAASMVGELGEHAHAHNHHQLHPPAPGATGSTTALSPKNYYELHLRALEELPTLEDYLLSIVQGPSSGPTNQDMPQAIGQQKLDIAYTMTELYDCVQYCPNVLSRLYLQICAASALIRSGQVGARWVLKDMIEAVKCVQNPVRGLFLRHYLLQAFRDKLPDQPIPLDQVGGPISATGVDASPAVATSGPVVAANVMNVEKGTVKDSYEFILANFIEMNKLWVRIQDLPGDGKSKEVRRRREKDRTELRILVGTNLVRLSALDSITSSIYGQVILPTVLDHIVICADPLAQAYLIDCIVQVFPDEYHIETMPILLGVCPKLRDKVNIRTILQSLMDRLANYLADEELLDEKDSNQVKRSLARDSFRMFDDCVQSVYNARGPKLQAKEVIRLQTALLSFTMKCYQGNMEHIVLCLNHCVVALQQASANQALMNDHIQQPQQVRSIQQLNEVASKELEKLLSIPLEELGLGVLTLDHYVDLIGFLPWTNRRQVALAMLKAVNSMGASPKSVKETEELFNVIAPLLRDEHDPPSSTIPQSFGGAQIYQEDAVMVSKLVHLLYHPDTDVLYDMMSVSRNHMNSGNQQRTKSAYVALVFAALKLTKRILEEEAMEVKKERRREEEAKEEDVTPASEDSSGVKEEPMVETVEEEEEAMGESAPPDNGTKSLEEEDKPTEEDTKVSDTVVATAPVSGEKDPIPKTVNCRKVFVFIQQIISTLAKGSPETALKLYLEAALVADEIGSKGGDRNAEKEAFGSIAYEFISLSFSLYEEHAGESKIQSRCIVAMIGTLLACRALRKEDYERLIMKTAQYAAKMQKKSEQCEMVASCSHLFYVVGEEDNIIYSNPQRGLECLQRALKLADACTSANPANLKLFIDLLEHYLFFFEKKNPSITGNYITGLVALIKEHADNFEQFGGADVVGAKVHFLEIVRHIKKMKDKPEMQEHFTSVDVSSVPT